MLPTRWDPFRSLTKELGTLHHEMDDLFRRTFGLTKETPGEANFYMAPAINTYTKGEKYFVEAELPGVSMDDLDVSIDGGILTLRGERKADKETKEDDYFIRESHYGSFIRRLSLPEGINVDQVHAKFEDGVLRISMPIEKKLATGRKVLIEGQGEKKKEKKPH
jgi:HSP20 family protein